MKKKSSQRKTVVRVPMAKKPKAIGVVTHFYGGIKVAIVKFKTPVTLGAELQLLGATTDFKQKATSFQFDHAALTKAPKGKEVGMKVSKKVREGDRIYLIS